MLTYAMGFALGVLLYSEPELRGEIWLNLLLHGCALGLGYRVAAWSGSALAPFARHHHHPR